MTGKNIPPPSQTGIFSDLHRETFDKANSSGYLKNFSRGLSEQLVRQISSEKNEPSWMTDHRVRGLQKFLQMPCPTWGPDLSDLHFDEICFYAKATETKNAKNWKEVPQDIKNTFEKLGIPKAEQKILAGAGAQYESDTIYHSLKKHWEEKGVIFLDMDDALQKYPDIVQKYFMKCVPIQDHKFSALHVAVWSGGTFLWIPKGVEVDEPLQAYFRMNAPGMGQFEHTLLIIEDGSKGHYIEGCSAPKYDTNALHAGCVEIFLGENAQFRYSSVENWSKDTYNLNTKRALVGKHSRMEWVGGNMGSKVTMLYPCSILQGEGASADHLGIAFANTNQNQDTGAKVFHKASNTSSKIVSKSLSRNGGISTYRGIVHVAKGTKGCQTHTECDGLILDDISTNNTVPHIDILNDTTFASHEANVGRISPDDMFYLQSRGIKKEQALSMLINGFLDPITRELPLEYAIEMNRLIELEMEGSVG
jgi:Fe-S cluster assembly protein SufB